MANKVILDAMIRRADFGQQAESTSIDLSSNLTIDQISGESPYSKLLRKPDFQRETNHWSPLQVATLIKSFATGELIPALILWKSDSYIFVIDGGHRLSALRAWVANDYGDKETSFAFFDGSLSVEQRKKAKETRNLVEKMVGRYSDFKSAIDKGIDSGSATAKLASNVFSRTLHAQWIQGSSEVAEASFFKINSQGTVLDDVEELLLKNRRKSYAIAARSIVRSGTGHKYWSGFEAEEKHQIEELSAELNKLLLQPELDLPIKTLDLPIGGNASPLDALKTLVEILSISGGSTDAAKAMSALEDDLDGKQTILALKQCLRVANRLTGNDHSSLGLHPAIYFYTERGIHSRFLFLGTLKALSDHIRNNNKQWFVRFTLVRSKLEAIMISSKILINQGLANVNAKQRIDRVAKLVNFLVDELTAGNEVDSAAILKALELKGSIGTITPISYPSEFTTEVKSAIFLKNAISAALKCPVCGGLLNPVLSASYDHVEPKVSGGKGDVANGQMTHPFCNTGMKGAS